MKLRKIIFCFVLVFVFSACSLENAIIKQDGVQGEKIKGKEAAGESKCFAEVKKQIEGNSMSPLLESDESVVLLQGYYDCNRVKRDDVVAYDYGGKELPIIKRVAVMGGDEISFSGNRLIVNNKRLTNSAGEEYLFNEKEQKMISFYIVNGKLTENGYLIFGDNVNNSFDSRKFGAVGRADFLGKFEVGGD